MSSVPGTGNLRFLEVKGRVAGAGTITITRNEILYSLDKLEAFILAIVNSPAKIPIVSIISLKPFNVSETTA